MTQPKHVALVGCGFTGTTALYQLIASHPVERVTVFEATGDFGPGYAYRTDESTDYLINNTTDTMCLLPSNRRAFVDWLHTRPQLARAWAPELDERGHLPRPAYGEFLKKAFAAARLGAAVKGIAVEIVPRAVTDIAETDTGVTLYHDGGQTDADVAILTTGRAREYEAFPRPPAGGAQYIPSHIACENFDEIPLHAEVHVMGASLSAYDVLNRLFAPSTGCSFRRAQNGELEFVPGPNGRKAVICSRSGRLKGVQSRTRKPLVRKAFTPERIAELAAAGKLDLTSLRDLISEDAQANDVELPIDELLHPYSGCDNRETVTTRAIAHMRRAIALATGEDEVNFLVDLFSDAQVDIWDSFAEHLLPAAEELSYRSRIETAILCYAAPCPVPTAERLLALMKAGRVEIVKGVSGVTLDHRGHYAIAHDLGTEEARILVSTIGAVNRDVTDPDQDDLTRNLHARGYLRPYIRDGVRLPGADVDMTTFRAKGARNIYLANMMLWGPGFFTSSAFMMATIVERLLSRMFEKSELLPLSRTRSQHHEHEAGGRA